jgi:DUF1680 family protein
MKLSSLFLILVALCITGLLFPSSALAADAPMGIERIARQVPPGYIAPDAPNSSVVRWVQIDLGKSQKIDKIKLLPYLPFWSGSANGYPVRFKVEVSDDPSFATSTIVADETSADTPDPGDVVGIFQAGGATGRYVRLTATKLRDGRFSMSKIEVWSDGKDCAVGCACSDSVQGQLGPIPLTRVPRPNGEEDVTDDPANVIPASAWKPPVLAAVAPTGNVHVANGVFLTAMTDNATYLMNSFSADELLRPFEERAGKPVAPNLPAPIPFWDTDLPGSNAGRFMMGAGNTLRWLELPDLRSKLNTVVAGIADCREPNGYIMGYPDNTIFYSERGAYTRSWVTHGLIAAGRAGNPEAFQLLRGFYDWFDTNPYLPELLRRAGQGVQGQIADTETYFTPIGKPKDIQTVQQYFQEDYWMDELADRDPAAIWQYPYDHPHNYLITDLEAYMDQYLATGNLKYLNASLGGWQLYHDDWMHIGGSVAITEGDSYPPKTYYLSPPTGELCGSGFWILFNQRFSLLYPSQEKYVAEIEKSIYNVGLANQVGSQGFRYHAVLLGSKEGPQWGSFAKNTCCEGQGTRLIGSLPEYIYTIAKDGIYVRLYTPSSISWKQGVNELSLRMLTQFPFAKSVKLAVTTAKPTVSNIRVRVPSWATANMPVYVNGKAAATGIPGSYVSLSRAWKSGDVISFMLPMEFRYTRYTGVQAIAGHERYALEYGPILMAVTGPMSGNAGVEFTQTPPELIKSLTPVSGQPLSFAIPGDSSHRYMPYWLIKNETFTCFPVMAGSADVPELSDASWIWYPEGNPVQAAPAGDRYFRRSLPNLDANSFARLTNATITVAADDMSTVYVNGKKAAETFAWQLPNSTSIKSLLKPGSNTIAIKAVNGGDIPSPAGLIARVQINFKNADPIVITTDSSWKSANSESAGWDAASFDDTNWAAAMQLGAFGMEPWGTIAGVR